MNLKKLSKGLLLTITSSLIISTIFLVYIFTLGARMTEARAIFIKEEQKLDNIGSLTEIDKDELRVKLEKSQELWFDQEVEKYLILLEN